MPNNENVFEFVVDSVDLESAIDDASDLDEDLDEDMPESNGVLPDLDEEDEPNDVIDPIANALRPGVPLLILHRSHQHSNVLPRVASDIDRRHAGVLNLGVVAPMPRMSPSGINTFLGEMSVAPLRFADPEAFARDDSFGRTLAAQREKPFVGPSTARHWAYLTDAQPVGYTSAWVAQVLECQRSAGATVLLTPGVWADPANPGQSMAIIRQHAEWARAAMDPTEHLAVNATLSASWLTNSILRDRLLNELVDMDEKNFYLRVRWPLMAQPYGQLTDAEILDGYIELANVCEDNDKLLLLPNTGLTGWIALAWGAHGFSTGIGSGERAFADTRVIRIKQTGPRPAPTRRTFVTPIAHVTDSTTSDRLEASGAGPCRCRFCNALRRLPVGGWDKGLAGAHYLRKVADLTAQIAGESRGRRVGARKIVRDASRFVARTTATVPLQGANDPKHLEAWVPRLR